jgi:hypothetical protein
LELFHKMRGVDRLETERQLYLSWSVGKYEISMCRLDKTTFWLPFCYG